MTFRDPVTQLPSEALFMDRLGQALALARRKRTHIGAIHLDIDGVDNLGGQPELINALARRLETVLRATDTVARLPGHAFTVLLNDVDSRAAARAVAEELALAVAKPLTVDGKEFRVRGQYGLALFPDDGADEVQLLDAAAPARAQAVGAR